MEIRRRSEFESSVFGNVEESHIIIFLTPCSTYFASSFNCFDVSRDQYVYVHFSHSKYELNLFVVK